MPARHDIVIDHARYRGRHRGTSTTTRAIAAGGLGVGTIAASIALPATAAQAATSSQWAAVAQCESGGDWAIDSGNGYYGGLQFAASTWDNYGGTAYAPTASGASEADQIAVANRVLAAQGWGAWPVCSQTAGVADTPTTDTDPAPVTASTSTTSAASTTTTTVHTVVSTNHALGHRPLNYRVKVGDSLESIAAAHHEVGGYERLFRVNEGLLGADSSIIEPGVEIHVQHIHKARHAAAKAGRPADNRLTQQLTRLSRLLGHK